MGPDVQSEQHFVLVRQVTDYAAQRRRQAFDQRRCREDFLVFRQLRVLQHVDDLELVLAVQIFVADAAEIGDGVLGPRRLARDVELEKIF